MWSNYYYVSFYSLCHQFRDTLLNNSGTNCSTMDVARTVKQTISDQNPFAYLEEIFSKTQSWLLQKHLLLVCTQRKSSINVILTEFSCNWNLSRLPVFSLKLIRFQLLLFLDKTEKNHLEACNSVGLSLIFQRRTTGWWCNFIIETSILFLEINVQTNVNIKKKRFYLIDIIY